MYIITFAFFVNEFSFFRQVFRINFDIRRKKLKESFIMIFKTILLHLHSKFPLYRIFLTHVPTFNDSSSFNPDGTSITDVWCLGIGSKIEISLVVNRIRQQQVANATGISEDHTSLKISKLLRYCSDKNNLKHYDYDLLLWLIIFHIPRILVNLQLNLPA